MPTEGESHSSEEEDLSHSTRPKKEKLGKDGTLGLKHKLDPSKKLIKPPRRQDKNMYVFSSLHFLFRPLPLTNIVLAYLQANRSNFQTTRPPPPHHHPRTKTQTPRPALRPISRPPQPRPRQKILRLFEGLREIRDGDAEEADCEDEGCGGEGEVGGCFAEDGESFVVCFFRLVKGNALMIFLLGCFRLLELVHKKLKRNEIRL